MTFDFKSHYLQFNKKSTFKGNFYGDTSDIDVLYLIYMYYTLLTF